jgi:hypothetical protein
MSASLQHSCLTSVSCSNLFLRIIHDFVQSLAFRVKILVYLIITLGPISSRALRVPVTVIQG